MAASERATDPKWFKDVSAERLSLEYLNTRAWIAHWEERLKTKPSEASFTSDPFRPERKLNLFRMILDEIGQELESRCNSKHETQK